MESLFSLVWYPLTYSFLIVTLITPLVIQAAHRFNLLDDPTDNQHIKTVHTYPVPRYAGIPIYVALVTACLIWLPLNQATLSIIIALSFSLFVGVIDDYKDLSPYYRLVANFITALIIIAGGISITYLTNPWTGGIINFAQLQQQIGLDLPFNIVSIVVTIIWIMALMNMIGIGAGGIEGQLPGVVAISAIFITIFSTRFIDDSSQWIVMQLASVTAGSFLALIPWNFFPQKIMPGYSGKSLAGLLLAVMAILITTKVGVTLIILGVPIADAFIAFTRRILSGKAPFWGDRGHLHHKLLDSGMSKPSVVFIYWLFTALLGMIALQLSSQQKVYALITVILLIGAIILAANQYTKNKLVTQKG